MPFSVTTRWDEHEAVVSAKGDVDLAAAAPMDTAIEAVLTTPGVESVVVNLSEVAFLDSSGISALLRGRRSADEHHVVYRVTGADGLVRTVLEMTGVWSHLSGQG